SGIINVGERLPHGGPIHVALAEIDPLVAAFLAFEILNMQFRDAFAERANPVLRVAVEDNVANIKPRLNYRTFEFVNVSRHFERAQEELVPNFLDADDDAKFLREGNE